MRRGTAAAALLAVVVALPVGAARGGGPNFVVTKVSEPPRTAREGDRIRVSDTVVNRGSRRAGASAVRWYLSSDPRRSLRERRQSRTNPRSAVHDVLMGGARTVRALAPGARSSTPRRPQTVAIVPIGVSPGRYRLLACADDRGAVSETREEENCRASRRSVTISPIERGPMRVDAFSDLVQEPPEENDVRQLEGLRPRFCQPRRRQPVPGLEQAISRTRAFLTRRAGADAMTALRRSPDYRSVSRLERSAARAALGRSPGAALAALLRAHELEPREASHLQGAGALANSVGLPAEGLAMLDAAARLDDRDRPAMGIGRHNVTLANRGVALGMLGRHAEADTALEAAVAGEPLLSEAKTSRSSALLCRRGVRPAVRLLRAGRRRQEREPPIDESRGQESEMRDLLIPSTPRHHLSVAGSLESQRSTLDAEVRDITQRSNEHSRRFAAGNARRTPAELVRGLLIQARLNSVADRPHLEALRRESSPDLGEADRAHCLMWSCSGDWPGYFAIWQREAVDACRGSEERGCFEREYRARCIPGTRSYHERWRNHLRASFEAHQRWFRAYSREYTGVAANLGDPDLHARAMLGLQGTENAEYRRFLSRVISWNGALDVSRRWCVDEADPPSGEGADTTPRAPASEGPCSPLLKGINAVWELGEAAAIKVNCERIQVEGSLGAGWIQGFGEVSYAPGSGRMTVFAGSKGSIGAGPAKGEFKSGIYVTVDSRGIQDAGWRVGPSATVSSGPQEFEWEDQIDISFVGAFAPTSAPPP